MTRRPIANSQRVLSSATSDNSVFRTTRSRMNRIRRWTRRALLAGLLAVTSVGSGGSAAEAHDSWDQVRCHEPVVNVDDHCVEKPTLADGGVMVFSFQDMDASISQTSSDFHQNVAMIASAATSAWGVSLEQMIEPLALATAAPRSRSSETAAPANSFVEINDWRQWLATAANQQVAVTPATEPVADVVVDASELRRQLDALATFEPLDVVGNPLEVVGSSIAEAQDSLVGSSGVVATVPVRWVEAVVTDEDDRLVPFVDALAGKPSDRNAAERISNEDYMPYDVASSDLPLWGYSPLAIGRGSRVHSAGQLVMKPFCVRRRGMFDQLDKTWAIGQTVPSGIEADYLALGDDPHFAATNQEIASIDLEPVDWSGVNWLSDLTTSVAESAAQQHEAMSLIAESAFDAATGLAANMPAVDGTEDVGVQLSGMASVGIDVAKHVGNLFAKLPIKPAAVKVEAKPNAQILAENRLLARANASAVEEPSPIANVQATFNPEDWAIVVDSVMKAIGTVSDWSESIATTRVSNQNR